MTSPKEILQARGIAEQAIAARWVEIDTHWHYPIIAPSGETITTRAKAYDSKSKLKYFWPDGKPDNPYSDYYILEDTKQAIQDAGGVVFLANGEAGFLAYRAGGIRNVFATLHTEMLVPKNIAQFCQEMGITKIVNIPDKDETGYKSAAKWRDSLRDTRTEYQVKQWPDFLPEKSDANDLWIALDFNAEAFKEAISHCQALILPNPEIKRVKPVSEASDKTPQGLIDTIANRLNIQAWDSDGFSRKNVICLFHDDKEESAGFNKISGVMNCFACGAHSPKDVAERLGIDWKPYYPKREKKVKKQAENIHKDILGIAENDLIEMHAMGFTEIIPIAQYGLDVFNAVLKRGWIDQDELPVSWIRGLLHLTHSKSATVLYAIKLHRAFRKRLLNQDGFTIAEAMQVLDSPRPSTQSALDFLTFLNCLMILDTKYLVNKDSKVTKSLKNSAGRKAIVYMVNTDTDSIIDNLISVLEPALLERLTEDDLAPLNSTMRDSLDLDFAEWKAWHEKTNSPKQQHILDAINAILCDVLENRASYALSDEDLQSPAHLRAKLLNVELAPYSEDRSYTDTKTGEIVTTPKGIQLSRAKLALSLGCSPSAMTKLYELANVGTERKRGWYEVINPNGCDILKELREAPMNLSKELSGVALGANIKVLDNGVPRFLGLAYADRAVNLFNAWNGHIEKLYIFVEQPSLLWNMSAEEIAQKAAKEAEIDAMALDSAETPEERAIVLETIEKKAAKKTAKPRFVSAKERMYKGHKPDWLQGQLGAYVHVWTWHKLQGLAIVDSSNQVLHSCESGNEVIAWLNRHAEKRQVRTIESYYNPIEVDSEVIEMPKQVASSAVSTPKVEPILAKPSQVAQVGNRPKAYIPESDVNPYLQERIEAEKRHQEKQLLFKQGKLDVIGA